MNIENSQIDNNGYQILIENIKWNPEVNATYFSKKSKNEDLPTSFALDLPENVINQANKKSNNFNDVIESFAYNFLTRKFQHEVNHCQIWLPLENA